MSASLSDSERRTLSAICGTLHPSITPEEGDDPTLFAFDALALGVDKAMEEALGLLGPNQQNDFRRLLRMLAGPLLPLLLIGRPKGFESLDNIERERLLLAMSKSAIAQLRSGFQGLRRLASFLFYALPDAGGESPVARSIGYAPPRNLPAIEPTLKLTAINAPLTIDCDVCVIGSGAGGGVFASELAAAGKRVVVLEAGRGMQAPDFDQHELDGMRDLYLDGGLTGSDDLGIAILAGGALGGGTAVNWQTSLRLPDEVRREWASLSGCTHFTSPSFTASLDAVATRLGLTTDESQVNANNDVLRRGCQALGYRWTTVMRNSHGCDPDQCGSCVYGCRHGGKQSTTITWLADAQRDGDVAIIPQCHADRVLIEHGVVQGVEATGTGEDGTRHRVQVRTDRVALAAGAIHTPMILWRSGLDMPQLGRNLLLHPTSAVAGLFADTIETWSGPPQTIMCDEFVDIEDGYGLRLETAPGHPGLLALALPWTTPTDHRRAMQRVANCSAIIVLTRDRVGGRVRQGSDGRPVIEYRPGARERDHLRRGIVAAVRVHIAAGAQEVQTLYTAGHRLTVRPGMPSSEVDAFCDILLRQEVDRNHSTLFSAHQMGTCRMGSDRRSAVCDENAEVFGVRGLYIADGSAFPASSGVNPMITIMAMAHHAAVASCQ